jgi:hypothetical protein
MDSATLGYVIAGAAGITATGFIMRGEPIATRGMSTGGSAGLPADDQTLPKVPWWLCGICPIIFGALVAVILWAVAGEPTPQPAIFLPATLIGFIGGGAGATVYRGLGATLR